MGKVKKKKIRKHLFKKRGQGLQLSSSLVKIIFHRTEAIEMPLVDISSVFQQCHNLEAGQTQWCKQNLEIIICTLIMQNKGADVEAELT